MIQSADAKRNRVSQRGSIAIPTTLLTVALLGIGALAIDAAYIMQSRAKLQQANDSIALAAVSGLLVSQAEALNRAQQYADLNPVLGQAVDMTQQQIDFGQWNIVENRFVLDAVPFNSVRVRLKLTPTTHPPAPALSLARILGFANAQISTLSTATLGNRDVMIVLDRSGSMNDDGRNPEQPLTNTKTAAKRFLDLLQNFPITGDQAGLVFFSTRGTLDNQLTKNFQQVKRAIDIPNANGWTNIAEALLSARTELLSGRVNPRAALVIVLLSDGVTNTRINGRGGQDDGAPPGNPSEQQALDQAKLAGQSGMTLYTISLGSHTNQSLMNSMAVSTGGRHFFSPTTDQLDNIFEEISIRVPTTLVE
ncbi:MAG: VWA domain-containing protein [Candidatus Omnitrophica bacterium]|nr:VWA domain-containing protein [Candidatus Omnitrophota bacterium]